MKKFIGAVFFLFAGVSQAVVLTFDDITDRWESGNVPAGYGGLQWTNLRYFDTRASCCVNGHTNGTVSGNYVIWSPADTVSSVSTGSSDTTFNFEGAWLTGAWRNQMSVHVEGLRNGVVIYDQTVLVDAHTPNWFDFSYNGIDTVRFLAYGGVTAGYKTAHDTELDFDNFTVSFDPIVAIDVEPWSATNEVRPASNKLIAVNVLGSNTATGDADDFDAAQVNPASLKLGVGEAQNQLVPWMGDFDGDTNTDAAFAFRTQDTGIFCGDTEVTLVGETYSGEPFSGTDTITTAGCEAENCHP